MSINTSDLINHIIDPTLKQFHLWSKSAQLLILATAAQETHMGTYLHQLNGPALGIFQMEPNTYLDIMKNVIEGQPRDWNREIFDYFGYYADTDKTDKLLYDLRFACLMCRLQYWRYKEPLPAPEDITGLYGYWKRYYNRNSNTGSYDEFRRNYQTYVLEE